MTSRRIANGLAGVLLAVAGMTCRPAAGDNPWLISEFLPLEQAVVVEGKKLGLTPEAAASLREQLVKRQVRQKPLSEEDRQFLATVRLGTDAVGRPVITRIDVHQ